MELCLENVKTEVEATLSNRESNKNQDCHWVKTTSEAMKTDSTQEPEQQTNSSLH